MTRQLAKVRRKNMITYTNIQRKRKRMKISFKISLPSQPPKSKILCSFTRESKTFWLQMINL